MTTPDGPDTPSPDDAAPDEVAYQPPSLSDRLAELEPDEDAPLFEAEYDDEAYEGEAYDGEASEGEASEGEAYDEADPATEAEGSEAGYEAPAEPVGGYQAEYEAEAWRDSLYAPGFGEPVEAEPLPGEQLYSAGPADEYVDDYLEPGADVDATTAYDDSAFGLDPEPGPEPDSDPAEDVEPDAPEDALDGPDHHYDTVVMDAADAATSMTAIDLAGGAGTSVLVAPPELPDEASPGSGRRRRRRRRGLNVAVLALLLMIALMAAATAYLWLEVREHDRTESARKSGLQASREAARLLFSYDYRTLDKDFSTGRALTTGKFRKDYERTTTRVVGDVAKQYKAVVKANVCSECVGVVRATPHTVVTVAYVNQVTTSTRVTGEKVDLSRVRMTLRRVDGHWLVENVAAL